MLHRDRALEGGRDPGVRRASRFANAGDPVIGDDPLLETPAGREDGAMGAGGADPVEGEARSYDVDAEPMSERTGLPDPGTTRETIDGLDETEEATRRAAEDYVPDRD